MVKVNRPVTGPDGITRLPGTDHDIPDNLVEEYRARGLLDEGDKKPRGGSETRAQQIAGVDPNTGFQHRGPVTEMAGPGDRGSAPGANDVGLSAEENTERTKEGVKANEETLSPASRATISRSAILSDEKEKDGRGGRKMAEAPENKARQGQESKS